MKALPLLGYFTAPDQTTPAVDPPHNCPCPVCGEPLTPDDVRTVSVMPVGGSVSAFYRLHRTCALALDAPHSSLLDDVALWILASCAPEKGGAAK